MGVELALAIAGRNSANLSVQKMSAPNSQPNSSPACPVMYPKTHCEDNVLAGFNDIVEQQWGGKLEAKPGVFEWMKDGLGKFFQAISNIGKSPQDKSPSSVLAGMTCGLISLIDFPDLGVTQKVGPWVHSALNKAGKAFNSSADEAGRLLFSSFCAISTALRAAIPVLNEVASAINDPAAKLIIKTAQFVLSAVYTGTSLINSLLAANDAVGRTPKESAVIGKISALIDEMKKCLDDFSKSENKAELIKNWTLKKIQTQIQTLRDTGLKGKLSTAREVLMLAGAVLSLVALGAALPAVAIGAGIANLVANIVEMQHGAVDFEAARTKVGSLVERKKMLEKVLANRSACSENRFELEVLLKIIDKDLEFAETEKKLAGLRIAKGLMGAAFSVSAIVTGSLMVFASISVPIWPAVATCLSLMGVLILSVANIAVKVKNDKARVDDENERKIACEIAERGHVDGEKDGDVSANRYVLLAMILENCDLPHFSFLSSSFAASILKKEELLEMEAYLKSIARPKKMELEKSADDIEIQNFDDAASDRLNSKLKKIQEEFSRDMERRLAAIMRLRYPA